MANSSTHKRMGNYHRLESKKYSLTKKKTNCTESILTAWRLKYFKKWWKR